jgi:hypothetical protein
MPAKLIVVHPFSLDGRNYEKGSEITDLKQIAKLQDTHDHHFVRVNVPYNEPEVEEPSA